MFCLNFTYLQSFSFVLWWQIYQHMNGNSIHCWWMRSRIWCLSWLYSTEYWMLFWACYVGVKQFYINSKFSVLNNNACYVYLMPQRYLINPKQNHLFSLMMSIQNLCLLLCVHIVSPLTIQQMFCTLFLQPISYSQWNSLIQWVWTCRSVHYSPIICCSNITLSLKACPNYAASNNKDHWNVTWLPCSRFCPLHFVLFMYNFKGPYLFYYNCCHCNVMVCSKSYPHHQVFLCVLWNSQV